MKEKNSIEQRDELEKYLSEPIEPTCDNVVLLAWWKHNSSRFPILSLMAKDVFATPVSTVASESAFSTGGRVVDLFRSCLSPEMTEALICSQNWLRPSRFQFKDLNFSEELEECEKIVAGMFSDYILSVINIFVNHLGLIWCVLCGVIFTRIPNT